MKKIIAFVTVISIAVALVCCNTHTPAVAGSNVSISNDSLVARGHYLVAVMGCGDCHSPKKFGPMGPQEDTSLLLSGYPSSMPVAYIDTATLKNWVLFNGMQVSAVGPWGVSFAANITSDSTGIGNWTEEQFVTALRQGKSKGLANNRMLLPPMPWPNYVHLKDEDMKAIFAYLKSTKPIKNVVPEPVPPSQFNSKK